MALSHETWLPLAQALRLGERKRAEHDCGSGKVMLISSESTGLSAFCFRCNDKGWSPPPEQPLHVRLERLRTQQQADSTLAGADLPSPRVPWSEWPAPARLWLLKAGLGAHDAGRLGAYYHPPTDRVVLPVLGPSGPVFWQARAVDGRQPKYLSAEKPAGGVLPRWGTAARITLTEDILSAYKVGTTEGCEAWCLMGTSLKTHVLAELLKAGKPCNIWLDPDAAGKRAASKAAKTLAGYGIECRVIQSTKDPKLLHRATIKELIA